MFVVNPGRTWTEPWRFLTYGFVHIGVQHLLLNVFSQILFGSILELSHPSWRVAVVYFSGIVLGEFGRELFTNSGKALAGTSGKYLLKI